MFYHFRCPSYTCVKVDQTRHIVGCGYSPTWSLGLQENDHIPFDFEVQYVHFSDKAIFILSSVIVIGILSFPGR